MRFFNHTAKLFTLCLAISFLSSCIPAALIVGATVGGAVVYDRRSMETIVEDRDAAQIASNLISAAPELKHGAHIVIATFDHVLLLVGQTRTEAQRDKAYELVSHVKYISRVYNEITIENPTSVWQRGNDAWITTKVKTEMMAKSGLHSTQIKVVTENSVVYLMGVLSRTQADMATHIARRVDGVTKVVKVFEYPQ
ncbi:MAG TPA: BON domain-containing protein [Coxiellaceae bacterium]|nr:BON domain-containing protein [Coxiellaceae bacterium]